MFAIDSGGHRDRVLARRDALVQAHLELVHTIARRQQQRAPMPSVEYDDMVGEGSKALIRAATQYRADDDTAFPAYATPWIQGAIRDLFRRRNYRANGHVGLEAAPEPSVCIPIETVIDQGRLRRKVADAIGELSEREREVLQAYYGAEELTLSQIAATMGVSESRVCQIRASGVQKLKIRLQA